MQGLEAKEETLSVDSQGVNPQDLSDPNYKSLNVPSGPLKISVKEARLDELFGQNKNSVQEKIRSVERQLIKVGEDSHLLSSKDYKNWKSYIETSARQLNGAILKGDTSSFSSKLSELSNSLKELDSFFVKEKDQGLVAVHAESGIRIYKRMIDGKEVVKLCTPDKKAFSDIDQRELQQYVKSQNGSIAAIDASKADLRQGTDKELSCRIDDLNLSEGDVYKLTSVTRENGFQENLIEFTRDQLNSGATVLDTTRGFGHGDSWPTFVVEIIPAGLGPNDVSRKGSVRTLAGKPLVQNPYSGNSKIWGDRSSSILENAKRISGVLANKHVELPPVLSQGLMRRSGDIRPSNTPQQPSATRATNLRPKIKVPRVVAAKGMSLKPSKIKISKFLKNHPRIAKAIINSRKQVPSFRSWVNGAGNVSTHVKNARTHARNIPSHLKNGVTHIRNAPARLMNVKAHLMKTPKIASNPAVRGTAYMSALVGLRNYCNGNYSPESEHTFLPSLLEGTLDDDKLRAWGTFKTKDHGVMLAWGVDTLSASGDLAILYGGAKGTQLAASGGLRLLGMSKTAGLTGGALKLGGRALGVAYAPVAGYSYFADGAFINESDTQVNLRVGGTIGEGVVSGFMVGGPWGAAGGALLATGGAMYGSYTALDNVIKQGRTSVVEAGVKKTLRRAREGWIMPEGMPPNSLPKEAENYIDKAAKADFMMRAISMGIDESKLGLSADDMQKNWSKIDSLIKEVKEEKQGYNGKYIPFTGYTFDIPLQNLSEEQKDQLIEMYDYSFNDVGGTKHTMTMQYQRAYLVESRDTSTGTTWDAIWDANATSGKVEFTDSMDKFLEKYEKSNLNLESREKALRQEGASFQDPRVQELIKDQQDHLQKEMPNFFSVISDTQAKNHLSFSTTTNDEQGRLVKESPIINSYAVEAFLGAQQELLARAQEAQNPETQNFILSGLEGDDKIAMQKHFNNKEILSEERFADLCQKAHESLTAVEEDLSEMNEILSADVEPLELMFDREVRSSILENLNSEEKLVVSAFWESGAQMGLDKALPLIEKGLPNSAL